MPIPTQYGSGPTLDTIFPAVPAVTDQDSYYAGFAKAMSIAAAITPSASGVAEYFGAVGYKKMFEANYLNAVTDGEVNDFNVGYNNALELAAVWEWQNDPDSGHNKVIS